MVIVYRAGSKAGIFVVAEGDVVSWILTATRIKHRDRTLYLKKKKLMQIITYVLYSLGYHHGIFFIHVLSFSF